MDARAQSDLHAVLGTLEDGLVKVVEVSPDQRHVDVAQRYLEETHRLKTLAMTSETLMLSDPSLFKARSLATSVAVKVAGGDATGALREANLALGSLTCEMTSLDGEPIFTGGGPLPPPP